jgi:DinB family protein
MDADTDKIITDFEGTLHGWIRALDDYPLSILLKKPAPDSWSLGQVYMHIINETNYFLQQVEICLMSEENSDRRMHADAMIMFQSNGFPDILIAGPPNNANTPDPLTKDEVQQGLASIAHRLVILREPLRQHRISGKTAHPGLQYLDARQWLRFAEMHMRHHFRQKGRIDDILSRG